RTRWLAGCRSRLERCHPGAPLDISRPCLLGGNHRVGSSHPAKIGAMCSRIIAARARLSGEEQAIVHRCGEFGSAIRLAGQGVRIGAAREWIGAPTFQLERLHPSGEIAAKQGDELADGKIDESNIISCLEFGCQAAAEISLDVGSAERAEMINASLAVIRASEKTDLFIKLLG